MKALMIKDLAVTQELDAKTMANVQGGTYGGWKMPAVFLSLPSHKFPSTFTTNNVSVKQANNQQQYNPTGNGSAVFGGSISAYNNQQGFNSISL